MPTEDETPSRSPFLAGRSRRDVALLGVGTLFGMAIGALLGLAFADDDSPETASASGNGAATVTDPESGEPTPTIDPTKTEFGTLTDAATESGVKVQWTAEITEGPKTGTVDFVAAHRNGTTAVVVGDTRVLDDGKTIRICKPGCQTADAAKARSALPDLVRPFWDIIRSVEESTGAPTYRITGETQLASGIFERCGQFSPSEFGIVVPSNVVTVSQCVDAQRNVPLRIGLNGEQRGVGGASLTAIADASADLFKT